MPIYEPWEVLNLLVPHTRTHTNHKFVVVLYGGGGGCKVKEERRLARKRAREERTREKLREKVIEREQRRRDKQQEKDADMRAWQEDVKELGHSLHKAVNARIEYMMHLPKERRPSTGFWKNGGVDFTFYLRDGAPVQQLMRGPTSTSAYRHMDGGA